MDREQRILILEDLDTDAELLRHALRKSGLKFSSKRVETKEDFKRQLKKFTPDLIIADYSLPQFDAMSALILVNELLPSAPVIILTATTGEELAADLIKTGAVDYVLKEHLARIGPAVKSALEMKRAKAEKARVEQKLRRSEEQFRLISENVADLIAVIDLEGKRLYRSPSYNDICGESGELQYHDWLNEIHPEDRKQVQSIYEDTIRTGKVHKSEYRFLLKNGNIHFIESRMSVIKNGQVKPSRVVIVSRDITERKKAEAKLEEMLSQIKKSRDDMKSILNQLHVGTAMTDREGNITFLSQAAEHIFWKTGKHVLDSHWKQAFPFSKQELAQLETMSKCPLEGRTKVSAHTEVPGGRHYWMEIDVQDDPRDSQRKIFFFYDVSDVQDLRRLLDEKGKFHDLIGKSKPMQLLYQQIQEVAQVDWTVLIEGETGTGKELVARAIHSSSHRENKPFIALSCAGLTESLLTSQLFGHKRGAFTGAIADHEGLFEAANGGTLFLDEIGDISTSVQTSLLRVLQEKEITRLGESKPRKIDVRVLTATHRNLVEEVEKGNFRSDLLYRIRVARIKLPSLQERRDDIALLVEWFLGQCRAATGKPVHEVSDEAIWKLMEYPWPGNVRELQSAVEFAVMRCQGSVLQANHLPPEIAEIPTPPSPSQTPHGADEKQRVLYALKSAKGNRTTAAKLLGISRATLYRRLADLGISAGK